MALIDQPILLASSATIKTIITTHCRTSRRSALEDYIAWENSVYTRLADISNRLIVMDLSCVAELVREGLP